MASKFVITTHSGFVMEFANGFKISVQWGPGPCYSDHHGESDFTAPDRADFWKSVKAEVAVKTPDGVFLPIGHDNVAAYCTTDVALAIMNMVAAIDPANPPESLKDPRLK